MFKRLKGVELKSRRKSKPITEQAVFVPMLAAWGAIVAAAMVYVLPTALIERLTPGFVVDMLGASAHYTVIALAAIAGALGMFVVARMVQRASHGESDKEEIDTADSVEAFTIDPSEELGSESLDAPLEGPFLRDEDTVPDEDADSSDDILPLDDFDDFDDFEELDPEWIEDRNEDGTNDPLNDHLANWAKGPQVGDRAETMQITGVQDTDPAAALEADASDNQTPAPPRSKPPVKTAIETLRAVPPQDLNLVQMVERLAVALHEKKTSDSARSRDAELAEALKHLSKLTEDGLENTDAAKSEMREALSKLQNLRGAA